MTIYLGENGHVELQRQGALEADGDRIPIYTSMAPEDVNVTGKRFSFLGAQLGLITGDRIEIKTVSGQDLQLVAGHNFPDWLGYINIDAGKDAPGFAFSSRLNDEKAQEFMNEVIAYFNHEVKDQFVATTKIVV